MRAFLLSIILICLCSGSVHAEELGMGDDPKKEEHQKTNSNPLIDWRLSNKSSEQLISLDGKMYKKSEIVLDFINMAIPSGLWFENTYLPEVSVENMAVFHGADGGYIREKVSQNYPWFLKFINRDKDISNRYVVNKWKEEFSISIGWPEQDDVRISKGIRTIEDEIKKLLPLVEKVTGLKTSYVSSISEEDISTSRYAKVRIIPTELFGQKNVFKSILINPKVSGYPMGIEYYEQYLFSGVQFTPNVSYQVEGYYLPNNNNEIDFSACKIFPSLKEPLLRSIVRECLFRSLGLAGLSTKKNSGIYSEWNILNSRHSMSFIKDGDAALIEIQSASEKNEEIPNYGSEISMVDRAISEYDLQMLGLLYCKAIKPSMSVYKLIDTLFENNECWQGAE